MAYDPEYYKKKALEGSQSYLNEQLGIINSTASKQTEMVNNLYKGQIADVDSQYADEERRNAVQKYINEQEVKETMANMGLTDSGLNRTQQTAVQLSAANNAAKLQRQKQNMVDSLTREMTAALADIETKRLSSESTLRQSVYDSAVATAEKARQADLDYEAEIEKKRLEEETKRIKEQQEQESKKLIYTYQGDVTDNYGKVTGKKYLDSNGKVRTVGAGINPYTGDNNNKIYADEAKKIGFFSNGYQPKGLVSEGGKFKKATDENGNVLQTDVTGKLQTIWQAPNGKYFIWRGDLNQYEEVEW
ncbi:MAG: hypothetical protein II306_04040 [Clostridia bacterium]|nr:hypothetical protein [Clostridia bacterium]